MGDFTAVLEAGVPLAEAQATFAAEGQMLAFDPPADPKATIGGAMATNDTGPLRHRYGGLRDLVVGTTVALSDGTLATSGGRVIKNVAGYDLGKLFCGSLRHARADHARRGPAAPARPRDGDAPSAGATTRRGSARPPPRSPAGRSRPTASTSPGATAPGSCWCASRARPPASRRPATAELMRELGLEDAAVEEDDDALWDAQRAAQRGDCVLKVAGRITDLPRRLPRRARPSWAVPASGCSGSRSSRSAAIAEVREALHPRACTLLDAPEALRGETWPAPDPGALAVMERLKQRFDPARAFRPGAFVGGL